MSGDLEQELRGRIEHAQSIVDGLDRRVVAHKVARYELRRACAAVYLFLESDKLSDLRLAEEAFRRTGVTLPEHERSELAWITESLFQIVTNLAEGRGRVDAGAADAPLADRALVEKVSTERGDEIDAVIRIMRNLPLALRRWTWSPEGDGPRWEIRNEAQVQSLLWLALAPSVPGLRDEHYMPSVGGSQSRADFAIPKLGVAIEVKFVRDVKAFSAVRDQLLADGQLYLSGDQTPFSRMIVLVWDDTRSTERHAEFEEGLAQAGGLLDVIVVPRPGLMES